ncbi:hypothetical protein EHQ12_00785 [Leptospira gomenensis]|uniref:N-formylglutamate amidohydrolase n=1 Tax=Leptospira gomenensis TaxID=2484974 RepID=A0A5F1YZA3_9LEPT|nr:hypothetical protein [Leptospira gomenensis]TGK39228.1 hypothetical protein EHQ17_00685 [Leptospira gomenensis]TGK44232.1 hypothetical protein EHQ07_12020 [Leptospira gomenensis]TGK45099.1 hypothetical protein EHQ12_00785 [Leptospira gomenensis]TGK65094.1 hypothetical protein EHQ13_05995 [Leptospira gomenensis]
MSILPVLAAASFVNESLDRTDCIEDIGCGFVSAKNGWSEIHIGELPIIITSPHGGTLLPSEMSDRTTGTLGNDSNTADLAYKIGQEINVRLGKRPHLVINRVDRSKVDMNRRIDEAMDDFVSPAFAENRIAYEDFHRFVSAAKGDVQKRFRRGILIDVHGHGQEQDIVQLGFNLTEAELESDENEWAADLLHRSSSVQSLVDAGGISLREVLIGDDAIGTLLEEKGYPSFPNRQLRNFPSSADNHYFTGGFISDVYGSDDGGNVDAFQMETPGPNVRNDETLRAAFAGKFAESLIRFLKKAGYTIP